MPMKNGKFFWLHSLYLFLFLLVGCQSEPNRDVVSFAFAGDTAELAAYQTLISAFEQTYPEITIQLRHSPSRQGFQQKLVTMFDAGQPPDVVLLNYRRFARFAADGDLQPAERFLDESDFNQAGFYPIALDAFTWQNELWCVPQNISSLVVYYNQDLFDAAGMAYPSAGWTWADFLQMAQTLTHAEVYGAGIDPNLYRLAPFVWQAGGSVFEAGTGLLPASPENLAALTWFTELQTQHGVLPNALAAESQPLEDRFITGRLGMFFDSRRATPTLRAVAEFRWDVAPLPKGEHTAGVLHSDGYCLGQEPSKATQTFIRFAVSAEGQTILAQTGRTVPSLRALAESDVFLDPNLQPEASQIWLDGVNHLNLVPIHPNWIQIEEMASAEIEQAFYGRITPEMALERISSKIAPLVAP
ncbi:MAG: multiple sugar transport system substrate-binding protein [Cellvibrionaceae bacterium]